MQIHTKIKGVGFDSMQLGIIQAISGVGMAFFTVCLFPTFANWMGKLYTLRFSYLFVIPAAFFPQLWYLTTCNQTWSVSLWFGITAIAMSRTLFDSFGFTAILILISNAAAPEKQASIQGFATGVSNISKTIAPFIGTFHNAF